MLLQMTSKDLFRRSVLFVISPRLRISTQLVRSILFSMKEVQREGRGERGMPRTMNPNSWVPVPSFPF